MPISSTLSKPITLSLKMDTFWQCSEFKRKDLKFDKDLNPYFYSTGSLIHQMVGLSMTSPSHLLFYWPIKDMMCGLEIAEETNTPESMWNSTQTRTKSSGSSLSNTWVNMTSPLTSSIFTTSQNKKFNILATAKEPSRCLLHCQCKILSLRLIWTSTSPLVLLPTWNIQSLIWWSYWIKVDCFFGITWGEFMNLCQA